MLIFSNPGSLDIRLATSFGTNVKENASAIGQFGTGLKYAIATILRLRGKISIQSDGKEYIFSCGVENIRGKDFEFIFMGDTRLAFTTELGKNWQPWMAYRELFCNAKDEFGDVFTSFPENHNFETHVIVECEALEIVHARREKWFLSSSPVWADSCVEIHPQGGDRLYYRGISVATLEKPSVRTYNLLVESQLTEDRTLASTWLAQLYISESIMGCPLREELEEILIAKEQNWESNLPYGQGTIKPPGEEFLSIVQSGDFKVNHYALEYSKKFIEASTSFKEATLSEEEEKTFVRAVLFSRNISGSHEIVNVTEDLPSGTRTKKEVVWISKEILKKGERPTVLAILSEIFSIQPQEVLLERLIRMQEAKEGTLLSEIIPLDDEVVF